MRFTSSVPSSMIVRSAAKSVSKTCLNPTRRRAAATRPVTFAPGSMPKKSPSDTRMAGAAWATTNFFFSCSTCITRSTTRTSCSAPVGHASVHWPQLTQVVSLRSISNGGSTMVSKPRRVKSMAATVCTSSQMRTHRPQRMHLSGSRMIEGELKSS